MFPISHRSTHTTVTHSGTRRIWHDICKVANLKAAAHVRRYRMNIHLYYPTHDACTYCVCIRNKLFHMPYIHLYNFQQVKNSRDMEIVNAFQYFILSCATDDDDDDQRVVILKSSSPNVGCAGFSFTVGDKHRVYRWKCILIWEFVHLRTLSSCHSSSRCGVAVNDPEMRRNEQTFQFHAHFYAAQ